MSGRKVSQTAAAHLGEGMLGPALQRYFCDYLINQRQISPRTVTSYRDTFRLLLSFFERCRSRKPDDLRVRDLDGSTVLAFLDDLERHRRNSARTRNVRLAAIRSFVRHATASDPLLLPVAQRVLAIPSKRFERVAVAHLTREHMQLLLHAPDISTETGLRDRVLLTLMYNTGARVSEVAAMKGVEQPPQYHPEGDVWKHTLLLLEQLDHPSAALALGALLHDVGKPATFRVAGRIRFDGHVEEGVRLAHGILHRLRFSREEMERVEALVANHMRFKDVHRMKDSTLKRFLRMPGFDDHLELHRLDVSSSNKNLENYYLARRKLEEYPEQHLKPQPLVTGADLIGAGYEPGPVFSRILEAVEDAQLEGRIHTSGEAMAMVRELFPK